MDGGGGVAFGEPVGEFGAEAGLEIDHHGDRGRRKSRRTRRLALRYRIGGGEEGELDCGGGGGGGGEEVVNGGDYAGGIEVPFDEETVGGEAAMERAGGDAVEIGDVVAGDGAEAIEIEMSVFGFEGIEGPFDEADVAAKGVIALEEF